MRMLNDARGITLAEILVATMIISIGLVGLAVVIPLAGYGVNEGNSLSTATFLAEQRLEEVRNADWTTTPSANDCLGIGPSAAPTSTTCARSAVGTQTACSSGTSCTTYPDEASVTGYPAYGRTVRVTDCSATSCAGVSTGSAAANKMRLVRVAVSYQPISGVGGTAAGSRESAVLELIVSKRE
jgi:type II secretory pathway pseudopilin PulG